jgi:hypothetical protein
MDWSSSYSFLFWNIKVANSQVSKMLKRNQRKITLQFS